MRDVWSSAVESFEVTGPSDVAVASAHARRLSLRIGATSSTAWEFAIAVSEAASNIHVHGERGTLRLFVSFEPVLVAAFEAKDFGPGMVDVDSARADGYSTGRNPELGAPRSLGCGLGAIERLMDRVCIESTVGEGTRLRAIKRL